MKETKKIDEFIDYLKTIRQLSPHTLINYKKDIKVLTSYLEEEGINSWQEVEKIHIRLIINKERRRGLNPRSLQRLLSSSRSFFNYLIEEGLISKNPTEQIFAPKTSALLPKSMDTDLIYRLLDFKPQNTFEFRDKAMIELLYSSGLRLSELCNVNKEDINLKECIIRVTGKGNKTRDLPIGRKAVQAIRDWLLERKKLIKNKRLDENQCLFLSNRGKRISQRSVQLRLNRLCQKRGLPEISPHV